MLLVDDLASHASTQTVEEFIRRHPAPVLVARAMLGGTLAPRRVAAPAAREAPATRRGGAARPRGTATAPGAATSVRAGTMAYVAPGEEASAADPAMLENRRFEQERYVALVKSPSSPPLRPVTLGRKHGCDVLVNDYTVSGEHAMFKRNPRDGSFWVVDLAATNGTWIGDEQLAPRVPCQIHPGDRLVLGRVVFTFLDARAFYTYLARR